MASLIGFDALKLVDPQSTPLFHWITRTKTHQLVGLCKTSRRASENLLVSSAFRSMCEVWISAKGSMDLVRMRFALFIGVYDAISAANIGKSWTYECRRRVYYSSEKLLIAIMYAALAKQELKVTLAVRLLKTVNALNKLYDQRLFCWIADWIVFF